MFVLIWVGAVVTVVAALVLGLGELSGGPRRLLLVATAVYLAGVQVPTVAINVPLNNQIRAVDVDAIDSTQAKAARSRFEARWIRWNAIRTLLGCGATLALLVVLLWR